jgi:hypothetical protein
MRPDPTCRRCGAPIRFVREVDTNRRLILNAGPVVGGNVVILGGQGHVLPGPSRGVAHTLHACGGGR